MKTSHVNLHLIVIALGLFAVIASAQINWQHMSDEAVLMPGSAGEWDDANVCLPTVIKDGDTLRMWYEGYTGGQYYGSPGYSGYAWSLNGITWHKHQDNPIEFKFNTVIKNGEKFQAWAPGTWEPGKEFAILYESTDCIHWTEVATTDLRRGLVGDWDSIWFRLGTVILEDNKYKMWYDGGDTGFYQVGLATSEDGIHWTKYDDPATTDGIYAKSDPVLRVGAAGAWDANRVFDHSVLKTTNGYEMWYTGVGSVSNIGYATSKDGIHWEKWPDNPIIDRATQQQKWGWTLYLGSVLYYNNAYHMWASGFISATQGATGYLISPVVADAVNDQKSKESPENFSLFPNYPNPFNPSTSIRYSIPQEEQVQLIIFDMLGKQVITLVDETQPAGFHHVSWDGVDSYGQRVNSGVYMYQITAGIFSESRKMILLK